MKSSMGQNELIVQPIIWLGGITMNEIDAIIYFDELEDLERFNPENITVSDHSETVDA